MTKASFPSDSIAFKDISTGHNSAGNGGDGYNSGDIISAPSINFQPYNNASTQVGVSTGDQVHQKASWDAGNAGANADLLAKAKGGDANSNGDQHSSSGHDTSTVNTDSTATQSNWVAADMSQNVYAGIGGNGGDHNSATGGNVQFDPSMETNLHFNVDDFGHIV